MQGCIRQCRSLLRIEGRPPVSSCWVCGGKTTSFYRVSAIPTSSCVLHLDPSIARAQPTGDLDLHICSTCGFIQNDSFDQANVDYLAPYEESQGSSSTFVSFMNEEIDRLGSEYSLHGRRVVDVGCGKGEWLAAACSRLGMTGLGIDPAYVPGRVGDQEALFEVLAEYFGPDHSITGDLVACRHTLEHVGRSPGVHAVARLRCDRRPWGRVHRGPRHDPNPG